ncbi:hypothetical protein [Acidovorax sp.]|uniref:hypothetical protein n=1 Tax=Acidovorax sp. TaxID=1872122 RepID=UPI00258E36F0|nr:hypothetical protein [Acidovorax sp.]
MTLADFDAAVAAHLAHGAMAGADPLIDSLYGQLEAPAAEGAYPASTAGAGLTLAQRAALAQANHMPLHWPGLVAAAAVVAAISHVWPWGFAL